MLNQALKPNKQRGVVLAISLVMLLLITTLAMSGMRATIMEERMASNNYNGNLAFQRAETALRAGEAALEEAPNGRSKSSGQSENIGLIGTNCLVGLNTLDFLSDATWTAGACLYGNGDLDGLKHKYYMEFLYSGSATAGNPIISCAYRVTARGYGDSQNSYATIQSTYKFKGCGP